MEDNELDNELRKAQEWENNKHHSSKKDQTQKLLVPTTSTKLVP